MVLKASAPTKHLVKEDGKSLKAEETSEFKIIEFNKENKRIVISHSRIWEEARADARVQEFENRKKEAKSATNAVKKVKESVEKSTLGDLSVLAQLKEQMEGAESKARKAPAAAPVAKKATESSEEEAK